MPSWEIFDHQTQEYRDSVLPPTVKARVAVERPRRSAGNDTSGAPATSSAMNNLRGLGTSEGAQEKFGFEPDRIAAAAKELLGKT